MRITILRKQVGAIFLLWLLLRPMPGQVPPGQVPQGVPGQAQEQPTPFSPPQPQPPGIERLRSSYVLGPTDQIVIGAANVVEIGDRPYRVDGDGFINLPLVGKVQAGGRTVEDLETELANLLSRYVQKPQVIITVVQFRSEPVFFVGAFRAPGIYPLQGRRTLVEMLSTIGGLQPNASRRIKVARRREFGPIPLPNAEDTPDGKGSVVEISMGSLRENVNPAEDIMLQPFDIISVERAEMVYINGEVGRVGSFELGERESISIVQAITLAGGLTRDAHPEKALILRPVLNTSRRAEVPVNLKRVLVGRESDFPLLPNDVLHVPKKSSFQRNLGRGLLIGMPVITTLIWVILR